MSKQAKLTESEIKACQMARDAIADIGDWGNTKESVDYWADIAMRLHAMATQGTSDGKPWVEPEPEINIDDKWAAVWPRRLVMVRDDECKGWEGPYHLGCVCTDDKEHPFSTVEGEIYSLCRPCTPDEIAAYESANGKQEQPSEPEPEIGEGYRVATEADSMRLDRERLSGVFWVSAERGITIDGHAYRVPVDRIPTDEDARSRPVVMVQDRDSEWNARTLLAVSGRWFLVVSGSSWSSWLNCRFPYPGEVIE